MHLGAEETGVDKMTETTAFNCFDYSQIVGIPETILRLELLAQRLQEAMENRSDRVLEVGVGAGEVTAVLRRVFDHVVCVDPDEQACRMIREQHTDISSGAVQVIQAEVESAALEPDGYDHIVLQNILEHLRDPVAVLRRLRDHLTARGRMYVSVPLAHSLHRYLGQQMGMISDVGTIAESDIAFGHYRVYTLASLHADVRAADLYLAYERPFYLKPLPTARMTELPMEIHRAMFELGRRFPDFAAYVFAELVLPG